MDPKIQAALDAYGASLREYEATVEHVRRAPMDQTVGHLEIGTEIRFTALVTGHVRMDDAVQVLILSDHHRAVQSCVPAAARAEVAR